ncbi:MAG: alpha/beta hydrolase [Pirellulaceae bacterium]
MAVNSRDTTPLVFFSGLAADASVFAPQKQKFPQLVVPTWPIPSANDSLDSYCDRLATDLGPVKDAIIGGASFGGIIALHVAKRLQPKAVLLIGSVRSPSELSRVARVARPLKPLIRFIPVGLLQRCCGLLETRWARRRFPHLSEVARQFRNSDPVVFRWSLARILDWSITPHLNCPVLQIHGDRDFVLPSRYTRPDVVIAGGGHVISLTHPSEVNDFIESAVSRFRG